MTVSLAFTHLTVHDVDAALGFYRDALGLQVRNDVRTDRGRWATLGGTGQPEVSIVLSEPHSGRSADDGDALQQLLVKGSLPMIGLATDDVDALFESVRAAGSGEVLQEPMDQPWGPRDCAFRDPSGNTVRITTRGKDT